MKIRLNKIILIIVIGVIVIMGILGSRALTSWREINEEKSVSLDEISEIQVTISSAEVHIIQTEASNAVKFHYHGKAMQEIKLLSSTNNKTVVAEVKRKHKALPLPEKMFLDIYIPKNYVNNFSVKISSCTVTMDSFNFESFTYNTSSGTLEAEQLTAEKISINTSSSNLNIKKIDTQEMEIYGSTTKISIDECIAKEANMGISTGSITLKNSSGNFTYKGSTGDVLIAYKEFENQNLKVETTVGNVTIELPGSAEFLLEAKTSTGKVQSDFSVDTAGNTDKRKLKGQIGTKSNNVLLQTSTGNINILKK